MIIVQARLVAIDQINIYIILILTINLKFANLLRNMHAEY